MKKWPVVMAIGVCVALVGTMAVAEDTVASTNSDKTQPPHKPADRFAKWDKNGDGKLSFDEFKARAEAFLAERQGDGKTEKKMDAERMKKRFEKIDTDHDGFLTKAELAAGRVGGKGHKGKDAKDGDKGHEDKESEKAD